MSRWDDNDKSSNPFYDDDSWGERRTGTGGFGAYGGSTDPAENRRNELLQKIKDSEERQLASQQRALVHLHESEVMGIAAAEELVRQGEQLDNVERKTDEIDQSMKTTQKHINSIRSVFGGLKNWFAGRKEQQVAPPKPEGRNPSRLVEIVENDRNEKDAGVGVHPAMRLREEDNLDSPPQRYQYGAQQQKASSSQKNEELFDQNLGLMSSNLSRLKNLSMAMNDEIVTQNEQLDRINMKVDRTDTKVADQNRQMAKILYNK